MKNFLRGFFIIIFSAATLVPGALIAEDVPTIVITEIGAYEKSDEEWIEIYNHGAVAVDLYGWKFWEDETNHRINLAQGDDFLIEPGEYAIIADVASTTLEMYPQLAGKTIFDSSWSSLKEDGEEIGLKDASNNFVEQFVYLAVSAVSLERHDPALAEYTNTNWTERSEGNSIGEENSVSSSSPPPDENEENDDGPSTTSTLPLIPPQENKKSSGEEETALPSIKHYSGGVVLINEFVSDPEDGEEWIELYNNSTELIDFTQWTLEDGAEIATDLSGELMPYQFKIIEKPKGQLNNKGDLILLKDGTGAPIDRVVYGNWDDGNPHDNGPVAKDPFSVARIQDGSDTNNDAMDFAITETTTKGEPNVITNEDTRGREPAARIPSGLQLEGGRIAYGDEAAGSVIINELLPNPEGPDGDGEFIELYNPTETEINIEGWSIQDLTKKKFIFEKITLKASSYLVMYRTSTDIALNNTGGETVFLSDSYGDVIDSTSFEGSAQENSSWARSETGAWRWTNKLTPGAKNKFATLNNPPIAVIDADKEILVDTEILFDASDSTDLENDPLSFYWDFGDGEESEKPSPRHGYEEPGTYTVVLTVSDGVLESKTAHIVTVLSEPKGESVGGPLLVNYYSLRITEFMPDPAGSDEAEWIEIQNISNEQISLEDVKLDDEDGGSRGYVVRNDYVLDPGDYWVFGRQETRLALNNTGDTVRLIDPFEVVLQAVSYDDTFENASFAIGADGYWEWTSTPTPGGDNMITAIQETSKNKMLGGATIRRGGKPLKEASLENVRELDLGDRARVSGSVSVLPSILGSQFFYINSVSSTAGLQVYSFYKDFPSLKVGDIIEVTGELSEAGGETRIKTKTSADIRVLSSSDLQSPELIFINQLGEQNEGALVRIAGEITQRLSSKVYIDDGTDELLVYIKEGAAISRNMLREGDYVELVGIFSQTSGGYRLLPRGPEDIVALENPNASFGNVENNQARDSTTATATSFLGAAAGTLSSLLVALIAKQHVDTIRRFGEKVLRRIRRKREEDE